MDRLFAFFAALALTTVTVSSACTAAAATEPLNFTLEQGSGDRIQARFREDDSGNNGWSSSFAPGELSGLDIARLGASGTAPLGFALVRDAGRLDCAGTGGNGRAEGSCRLTADAAFLAALSRHGVAPPSQSDLKGLVALNVQRELVETLLAARYPLTDLDDLMGLTALGVSSAYINDLAGVGYRPESLDSLMQFAALDIGPDFIRGFVRLGYDDLPADELVQLKALNVTADYMAGFERIGYGRLPASELVQLKALGVTPDYVASLQRPGQPRPPVDKIVEMKALGLTADDVRAIARDARQISLDALTKLRAIGLAADNR